MLSPSALGIIFGFQAFLLLAQFLLIRKAAGPSVIHIPVPFAVIPAKRGEDISWNEKTDPGSNPQEQLQ